MFLEYGINADGALVRIDEVGRGRLAGVYCPYCQRPLLARKGAVKAPHFAHDGETCAAADRPEDAISLPAYDRFLLNLSGRELEGLRAFYENRPVDGNIYRRLESRGLVTYNPFSRQDEVTKLGKIPLGALSLMLFNDEQERMIRERHEALEAAVYEAIGSPQALETALTDLRLYRAQWRRILSLTLYFMEIKHSGGTLHKVGVTSRTTDERTAEIAADLHAVGLTDVSIKVLGTWAHRGNVELYFKYRYAQHQHRLGTLTEYFNFGDRLPNVKRDLNRMKPKALDEDEQAIVAGEPSRPERGEPSYFEVLRFEDWLDAERAYNESPAVRRDVHFRARSYPLAAYVRHFGAWYHQHYAAEYARLEQAQTAKRRRDAIRAGMRAAAERGRHVGRPADPPELIVARYPAIVEALQAGLSLRAAATQTSNAVNTVRKVKRALDELTA